MTIILSILGAYLAIGLFLAAIEVRANYDLRMARDRRVDAGRFILSGILSALLWPYCIYKAVNNG